MRINYIKKTLKNGVKLYLYIDPKMKKTFVEYGVNYGSSGQWFDFYLDGQKRHVLPGCAHFLEHMLGEHSKYGNIYKIFNDKKYIVNAQTSDLFTHYFFIGVDDIYSSIEMLINTVDDPVFNANAVIETRPAISEETKRGLNNKEWKSYGLFIRNIYKGVSLWDESLSPIGDEFTTDKLDYAMLKDCYDAFYYDENKTLIIAGNFDENDMTEYIESIYAKLNPHKNSMEIFRYGDLEAIKTSEETIYMPTDIPYVSYGFKNKIGDYSRKEIFYYLSFLLDYKFSNSSTLTERLKKENVIAAFDNFDIDFFREYFTFCIYASVKDIPKYKRAILENIGAADFTEYDFELFKRSVLAGETVVTDKKYSRFLNFAYRIRFTEDFDDIEFVKTLTYRKFIDFFNLLHFDNATIGIIEKTVKTDK